MLVLAASTAFAADAKWKTTPLDRSCKEMETGAADEGQDALFKRCTGEGKASVWILYQEGTRMSVGFGSAPHVAAEGLDPNRSGDWPVEWGGTLHGGAFVPEVVIVRFRKLEEVKTTLFVFRIVDQRTSCLVAEVPAGPAQNDKAKAIANASLKSWKCLVEPIPVTS